MKYAIVGSLTALLAGAGLALAQPPAESLPAPRNYGGGGSEVPADQATPGVSLLPGPGMHGPEVGDGAAPGLIPAVAIDGVPYHCWVEGDYLHWWLKENRFPALLTTSPTTSLGILGQPGTTILVGNNDLDRTDRNGAQLTLGGWITDYHGFGLEGSFFYLEGISRSFSVPGTAAAGTVVSRPFFNLLTGQEAAVPVSVPTILSTTTGTSAGTTAGINCDNGRFQGAEVHFLANICYDADCRLDFLIGYRYLSLNDHFAMQQTTLVSPTPLGSIVGVTSSANTVTDRFDSSNHFNGGQIGLRGEWRYDRWSLRGTARVSFGANDVGSSAFGQTVAFAAGAAPITIPAGFLVTNANSGAFHNENFSIVPEVGATLGFQVCDWMKLTAGYSFLYWSNVVRTGDQVPHAINPLAVPSLSGLVQSSAAGQPLANIRCTDFWAQGISAGLELRF
jgi:hypothetical protein